MAPEELTLRIVALFLLLTLGAACGGDDDNDATQPATQQETGRNDHGRRTGRGCRRLPKEVSEQAFLGQWGRMWESLHPDHKAIVSREKYLTCRQEEETITSDVDIDVVDSYEEPILVQGSGTVDSTAVTLRLSHDHPLTGKPAQSNITAHAVPVDGEDVDSHEWGLRRLQEGQLSG